MTGTKPVESFTVHDIHEVIPDMSDRSGILSEKTWRRTGLSNLLRLTRRIRMLFSTAEKLGRDWVGIEKEERWFETAKSRISEVRENGN